jgi:hypothetical protein
MADVTVLWLSERSSFILPDQRGGSFSVYLLHFASQQMVKTFHKQSSAPQKEVLVVAESSKEPLSVDIRRNHSPEPSNTLPSPSPSKYHFSAHHG